MAVSGVSIGRFRRRLEPLLSGLSLGVRETHRGVLRAVLLGLLRWPSPYVADIARGLGRDFGPTLDAREHRLLRFLGSPRLRLGRLKAAWRRVLAGKLPPKGRVLLHADLSDVAKPHAWHTPGIDRVRDGSDSDKRIVPGYWLNEVYVELAPGRPAPVVFELYSLRSGETLSQTNVLLRGMDEAFEVTGPRGVLVADRGYDDRRLFEAMLLRSRDFIIRLQTGASSRRLVLPDGHGALLPSILRHLPLPEMLYNGRVLPIVGKLGWQRVHLPGDPDHPLTLVVAHMRGYPRPMALLTTLPVSDVRVARWVVAAYLRRWNGAEDSVRFLKQSFDLEKVLVSTLDALQVWVFLMGVAMGMLSLLLHPKSVGRRLAHSIESFAQDVQLLHYRLARAVSELLRSLTARRYRAIVLASGP